MVLKLSLLLMYKYGATVASSVATPVSITAITGSDASITRDSNPSNICAFDGFTRCQARFRFPPLKDFNPLLFTIESPTIVYSSCVACIAIELPIG